MISVSILTPLHCQSRIISMGTAHDDSMIPTAGNWPVDPQEDVPISKDRIWIDGCFDFAHHGMDISQWHLKD